MNLRLPPELIDRIVDHLFDNLPTLTSIRFSNRAFNASCRRYIFRTMELDVYDPDGLKLRIKQFEQLVASSPNIMPLVKELTLNNLVYIVYNHDPELVESISGLISRLTQVAAFDFGTEFYTDWDDWPSAIRSVVKLPLSSPGLRSAGIFNVKGAPTSLLGACPALEHLTLWNTTFEDDGPNVPQPRQRLQSLDVAFSNPDQVAGGIPVDLSHLQHLKMTSFDCLNGPWAWNIIVEPASKSLKSLHIELGMYMIFTSRTQFLTIHRRGRHLGSNRI